MSNKNIRHIVFVLEEMLRHIPEEHALVEEFKKMQKQFAYMAPELAYPFNVTSQKLGKYIPRPTEEWHYEIISIFMMKTIEELKELFPNGE